MIDYREVTSALQRIEDLVYRTAKTHETTFDGALWKAASLNNNIDGCVDEIRNYRHLRHLLAHDRPRQPTVLQISEEARLRIIEIERILLNPVTVIERFEDDVSHFDQSDTIGKAVAEMKRHSYSQVPVVKENGAVTGLLTMETISRWLASCIEDKELAGLVDVERTKIKKVLDHAESDDSYSIIPKNRTCCDALKDFEDALRNRRPLDALLITETGDEKEPLLGIITAWDVPDLVRFANGKKKRLRK